MLGLFGKKNPELSMGLDHDDSDGVVDSQTLPEYDHGLFEEEGVDVNDD